MNFSHDYNEKSSFERLAPERHILAHTVIESKKGEITMLRAYPYFMAAHNERRSSKGGFLVQLLRLLGRGKDI
jgi:hypothetical protein